MKSYAAVAIAFLLGVLAVSAGWGGAIYSALLLIGFMTLVVLVALVWSCLDQRKSATRTENPSPTSPDAAQNKTPSSAE